MAFGRGTAVAALGLAGIVVASFAPARAIPIQGSISTTTWTRGESPYVVTGPISVPSGNTLTIGPGVDVLFAADVPFVIDGKLLAIGAPGDSIRFLAGTSPAWGGLRFSAGTGVPDTIAWARISGANAVSQSGGGIYSARALALSDVVLSGNRAYLGAGAYLDMSSGASTFLRCRIRGNVAGAFGGGVAVIGSTTSATLERCTVDGNEAKNDGNSYYGKGGGLYANDGGALTASFCTIIGNRVWSYGGGVHAQNGGSATVRNSIVSGNQNYDTYDNRYYWYGGSPGVVTVEYSVVSNPIDYSGTGNIWQNPKFVDSAAGDYRLTVASPCVDAGDPAAPVDPDGSRADMGAIPFDWTTAVEVTVPDLAGMTIGDAVGALRGLGIVVAGLSVYQDSDPATWNWITDQSIMGGAMAWVGSEMTLTASREPGPSRVTIVAPTPGATWNPGDRVILQLDKPFAWTLDDNRRTYYADNVGIDVDLLGFSYSSADYEFVAVSNDARRLEATLAFTEGPSIYVLAADVRPSDVLSPTTYFTTGAPIPTGAVAGAVTYPALVAGMSIDRSISRIWTQPENFPGPDRASRTDGDAKAAHYDFDPSPGTGFAAAPIPGPGAAYRIAPLAGGNYQVFGRARFAGSSDNYGRFLHAQYDGDRDGKADMVQVGGVTFAADLAFRESPIGISQGDFYVDTAHTTFRFDIGDAPANAAAADIVYVENEGWDIVAGREGVTLAFLGSVYDVWPKMYAAIPGTPGRIPSLDDVEQWGTSAYAVSQGNVYYNVFAVHTPEGAYGVFAVYWPDHGPTKPANAAEAARAARLEDWSQYIVWAYRPDGSAYFGPQPPTDVVMPNLVGLTATQMWTALDGLGTFTVDIEDQVTNDPLLYGKIRYQSPLAGSLIWNDGGYISVTRLVPPAAVVGIVGVSPADGAVNVGTPAGANRKQVTLAIALSRPIELILDYDANDNRVTAPNLDATFFPAPQGGEDAVTYAWNAARDTVRATAFFAADSVYDYVIVPRDNDGMGAELPEFSYYAGTFTTSAAFPGTTLSGAYSIPDPTVPVQIVMLLGQPPATGMFDVIPLRLAIVRDGRWTIRGVLPGTHWPVGYGMESPDGGQDMPRIYVGAYDPEGDGIPNPVRVTVPGTISGLDLALRAVTFGDFGAMTVVSISPTPYATDVPTTTTVTVTFSSPIAFPDAQPDVDALLLSSAGGIVNLERSAATVSIDGRTLSWQVTLAAGATYEFAVMKASSTSGASLAQPVLVPFSTGSALAAGQLTVNLRLVPGAPSSPNGYFAALLRTMPTSSDPDTWDIAWIGRGYTGRVELRSLEPGTYYIGVVTPENVLAPAIYAVGDVPQAVNVTTLAQAIEVVLEPGLGSIKLASPMPNATNIPTETTIALTFDSPHTTDEGGRVQGIELLVFPSPLVSGRDSLSADGYTLYRRVQLLPGTTYQVLVIYDGEERMPASYVFSTGVDVAQGIVAGQLHYAEIPHGVPVRPSREATTSPPTPPLAVVIADRLPSTLTPNGPPAGIIRIAFVPTPEFVLTNVPPGDHYLYAAPAGDPWIALAGAYDRNGDGVPDRIRVEQNGSVLGLDFTVDGIFGRPRMTFADPGMFETDVPAVVESEIVLVFSGDLDTSGTDGHLGNIDMFPTPPSGQVDGGSFAVAWNDTIESWIARAPVRLALNTTYTILIHGLRSTMGPWLGPISHTFTTASAIPTGQIVGQVKFSALVDPVPAGSAGVFITPAPQANDISVRSGENPKPAIAALAGFDGSGAFRIRYVPDGAWYPTAFLTRVQGEDGPPRVVDYGQYDPDRNGTPDPVTLGPASRKANIDIEINRRGSQWRVLSFSPADGTTDVAANVPVTVTIGFSEPVFAEGLLLPPGAIAIFPQPLSQGEFVQGADNATLTFTAVFDTNAIYQIGVTLDEPATAYGALFTTGAALPAGRISGRVDLASDASERPDATFVSLLTEPPASGEHQPWKTARAIQTVDGRFSVRRLPAGTYYPLAVGSVNGKWFTSSLAPNPLVLPDGGAVENAYLRLGESAATKPPKVISFDVALVHMRRSNGLGGTIDAFIPVARAVASDPNGIDDIDSATVTLPNGTEIAVEPTADGHYVLVLDPLATFAGGTFAFTVKDRDGATASATDLIAAPTLGMPVPLSPVMDAHGVSLTPLLDWADLTGAAGYKIHLTTYSPIDLEDPVRGLMHFLDPEGALVNFDEAPVQHSEYRVPSGRLAPETDYWWAVGAVDRMSDVDYVAIGSLRGFETGTGTTTVDATPPVIVSRPEIVERTENEIEIAWSTDELSDSRIFWGRTADALADSVVNKKLTREHEAEVEGLAPGTEYYLAIASVDFAGNRTYQRIPLSVTTAIEPDDDAPEFDMDPVAVGLDSNRATIQWATDELTTGAIVLSDGTRDTTIIDARLVRAHEVTVVGLLPGMRYTFSVAADDIPGNGPTVKHGRAFTTPVVADRTPPRLLWGPAVTAGDDGAHIAWGANEPHTSIVRIFDTSGGQVAELFDDKQALRPQVRIRGLAPGTEYRAVVWMRDAAGNNIATRPESFRTRGTADTTPPRIVRPPAVSYAADTRVVVEWETDEPADSYVRVYLAGRLVTERNDGALVRVHRVTLTNLAPGATYQFVIISADAASNNTMWPEGGLAAKPSRVAGRTTNSFSTSTAADVTPPQVVNGPVVLSQTATTLTVGWTTDETANGAVYFGENSTSLAGSVVNPDNVTDHSVTVTGLARATRYALRVGSTDPSGNGETTSGIVEASTLADEDLVPPAFTESPALAGRTDTRLTVRWLTNEPADSRVRYRKAGTSDPFFETHDPMRGTEHVLTITNLDPSTSYELVARSSDLVGNTADAGAITGATQAAADVVAPLFTGGPTVVVDAAQARITWTTDEPADSWVAWGQTAGFGSTVTVPAFSSSHQVVVTNILPSTMYYFGIASSDASGNIADSTSTALVWTTLGAADTVAPAKVGGLSALVGSAEVRLAWQANIDSDLAGYVVERSGGGGAYAAVADVTQTGWTDNGIAQGTSYAWRVRARDNSTRRNLGEPSDPVAATPSAAFAPGAPVPVDYDTSVSVQPALIVQNAPAGNRAIAGYSFVVALDQALTQVVATISGVAPGSGTTQWQVPFALDSRSYWWAARAVDAEGFSGPLSTVTDFLVDASKKPQAIRLATLLAVGRERFVAVRWEVAAGSSTAVFNIWRDGGDGSFARINPVAIAGRGPAFGFTDVGVVPGRTYRYRLEAVETGGRATLFGPVEATLALPARVALGQNVPNPFNPSTRIAYEIPQMATARLVVYNMLGQEVRVLVDGVHTPGWYSRTWDGRDAYGRGAASGLYIARLVVVPREGAGRPETRVIRMLMVR